MESNPCLNKELLSACLKEPLDLELIETLLKNGARPLGTVVDDYGTKCTVYSGILDEYDNSSNEDNILAPITKLFIKYGMDMQNPDLPYDDENINPLWDFAFYNGEDMIEALKMLLDSGLDLDSVNICLSHLFNDIGIYGYLDHDLTADSVIKIMLIAAYVIDDDPYIKRDICFDDNNYDISKFKEWRNYRYEFEEISTEGRWMKKLKVDIFEMNNEVLVWSMII